MRCARCRQQFSGTGPLCANCVINAGQRAEGKSTPRLARIMGTRTVLGGSVLLVGLTYLLLGGLAQMLSPKGDVWLGALILLPAAGILARTFFPALRGPSNRPLLLGATLGSLLLVGGADGFYGYYPNESRDDRMIALYALVGGAVLTGAFILSLVWRARQVLRREPDLTATKSCPECRSAIALGRKHCGSCGHDFASADAPGRALGSEPGNTIGEQNEGVSPRGDAWALWKTTWSAWRSGKLCQVSSSYEKDLANVAFDEFMRRGANFKTSSLLSSLSPPRATESS